MSRPGSVLLQTGLLSLVAVVVAVAICFGVVLGLPLPSPPETSIGEMAAVMRDPEGGPARGFRVAMREGVPEGPQSALAARGLAAALRVPEDAIRVVWQRGAPAASAGSSAGQALLMIAGQEVVVDSRTDGFDLRSGTGTRLRADTRLPAFRAALRQADGRWLVVAPPDSALDAWRRRVFLAFLASAGLVAPVAWWLARKLTGPLRRLAAAANDMQLDRSLPLPTSAGPREVREIAAAMAAMHARMAAQAAERTRMLVAVAHDLRTPLTGLRIRVDSVPPDARQRMVTDIDRMAGMIQQVLDYARGAHAQEPAERIDVAASVAASVEDAVARGGTVAWTPPADRVWVIADPVALRRAFDNLLDNALRYGAPADVSLELRGRCVCVRIRDRGPGIPVDDVARLLQPFERGEPSRSRHTGGLGLGLAIAHDVVVRHRGVLRLGNGAHRGLEVEIELPLA